MIHAFFCFLISLLLFVNGLGKKGIKLYVFLFLSTIFGCLAVNFKADIILCFGAFLGIVLYTKSYSFRCVVLSFFIPSMALISVLVLSRIIFPSLDARLANPKGWNQTFPFTLEAITNEANFSVIPKSAGKWMFLAIAIAGLICLFKKEYRQQLLLVIFGAVPTFLFWGLIMGNSARHMMVAYFFLVFMLTFVLFEITKKYKYWPIYFVGLIVINYFSCEASGNIYRPSSRLFAMTKLIEENATSPERCSREFYDLPYSKKLYLGQWESPYIMWGIYCMASEVNHVKDEKAIRFQTYDVDGTFQEIKFRYIIPERDGNSFGPMPGWHLWTCNKSINIYNE